MKSHDKAKAENLHACEVCDKKFVRKDHLKHHMAIHNKSHKCGSCRNTFDNEAALKAHEQSAHTRSCHMCGKKFTRAEKLTSHIAQQHNTEAEERRKRRASIKAAKEQRRKNREAKLAAIRASPPSKKKDSSINYFKCAQCRKRFDSVDLLKQHVQEVHGGVKKSKKRNRVEHALEDSLRVVTFNPEGMEKQDILQFFSDSKDGIAANVIEMTDQESGCKWFISCLILFSQLGGDGEQKEDVSGFTTRPFINYDSEMDGLLDSNIDEAYFKLYADISKFQRDGSGWEIEEVLHLKLSMAAYQPLAASSFIPLPYDLSRRRSILNIENDDQKCFLWSVLAHLYPAVNNKQRVGHYKPYEDTLDMDGIVFPVQIKQIPKFTNQNDISVNVFGYQLADDKEGESSGLFPLFISDNQLETHVNLLLYKNELSNAHYCLITDFHLLLTTMTKCDSPHRYYFCSYCLHGFVREELLVNHIPYCKSHGLQKVLMPPENKNIMKFHEHDKSLMMPYVIYADFECLVAEIDDKGKTHKHEPCSYAYRVVSNVPGRPSYSRMYRGVDAVVHFLDSVLFEGDQIVQYLKKTNIPLVMSQQDEKNFKEATHCSICEEPYDENDIIKVRDHDHLTGCYRGSAHQMCNLQWKYKYFVPVFFHNLKGYDSHLLCQFMGRYKKRRLTCIPRNMEQYTSFTLGPLRFVDTLSFMSESLDNLVKNLGAEGDSGFIHTKSEFKNTEQLKLVIKKGVYPYEYMNCMDRFNETSLPPKEAFYSTLTMSSVSDEAYAHAQNVWEKFHMNTLGQYHDLYLKTDVLLLADCMENFRKTCMKHYRLDPAHFLTLPGMSWAAALKFSKVELELLTDLDQHLFVEKGIRGGISMISTKWAKANNPLLPDTYKPDTQSSWIWYIGKR